MIINLISSPRNISTALMYSFANRSDTKVVDEPFYSFYLKQTGVTHPGRENIIASQSPDPYVVIRQIESLEDRYGLVFVKNMAHHLIKFELTNIKDWRHIFLIRDPRQLIASFSKVITAPSIDDIGSKRQYELYQELGGTIINSNKILDDPSEYLTKLCDTIEIPFLPEMLQWPAGPIPEDGVWATYWYANVHKSTGFSPTKTSAPKLTESNFKLYLEAKPFYDSLKKNEI